MSPTELMNILRLADTGELREILENFQEIDPLGYRDLVKLVQQYEFKRKPHNE